MTNVIDLNIKVNDTRTPAQRRAALEPTLIAALEHVPGVLRDRIDVPDEALVIVTTAIDEPEDADAFELGKAVWTRLVDPPVVSSEIEPAYRVLLLIEGRIRVVIIDRATYARRLDVEMARGTFCRTSGMDWHDWLRHEPGTVCCLLCSHYHFFGARRVQV